MRFEIGNQSGLKHGYCRRKKVTPEYRCWSDIKRRCLNPKSKFYKYYGGRGIIICAHWANDFSAFLSDVGRRPSPKHTIDRYPDNNGNYEPGNVRWATRREQMENTRSTRMVMLNGEYISIAAACRRLGLTFKTVSGRIDRGWRPEDAITPPLWSRPDLKGKRKVKTE